MRNRLESKILYIKSKRFILKEIAEQKVNRKQL